MLATAADADAEIVAIDPHAGSDRGPQEFAADHVRGDEDYVTFTANLERAGVAGRVRHVRRLSGEALDAVDGQLAMLYIDGAHRYAPARDDISRWGARVAPGATMLIHDSFSSIGVTLAILRELALGRAFVYEGRSRSLAQYRRVSSPLTARERATNAGRQLAQLPWFARNVAIKVAILCRLPGLARLLGHDRADAWPY